MFSKLSHVILTLLASSILFKLAECSQKRLVFRAARCLSGTANCDEANEALREYNKLLELADEKADVKGVRDERATHSKEGYFRSRSKHASSVRTAKRLFEAKFSRAKTDRHYNSRINENKTLDRVRRSEWKFDGLKNAFRNARMNQMLYG